MHKSGNELSLDLHKSGNELSLDLNKSHNELSLDLHTNESPKWNSSLLDFLIFSHMSEPIDVPAGCTMAELPGRTEQMVAPFCPR